MSGPKTRRVAVVTGTRAEYGLLKPVMQAVRASKRLQLRTIVTGMHLAPAFGNTIDQVRKDGFRIDARVDSGKLRTSQAAHSRASRCRESSGAASRSASARAGSANP